MNLTQALVHELLKYDPHTGQLTWRRRSRKWFKNSTDGRRLWNIQFAGKPALSKVCDDGYLRGKLFRKKAYRADTIIWFWMTGDWPKSMDREGITHLNGNRSDNRWCNLHDKDEPARVDGTIAFIARPVPVRAASSTIIEEEQRRHA
ncbi:HNH endonuclease [Pseudorhodoplanes sp.]|uniref:HNH endonuclease n=1 Tax=Pseudorhodoplanes sp. TaxID=1934341 RepID=UPI003D12581F